MVSIFTRARLFRETEEGLFSRVRYAVHHPEAGTPCVGRFGAVPYNEQRQLELEKQRAQYEDRQRKRALRKALYDAVFE